jgi:hypothetical protein
MDYRRQVDPVLRDIVAGNPGDEKPVKSADADSSDAVGDLIFNQVHGIDRPKASPEKALTVEEIAKACETIREQLGNPALSKRFANLRQLVKASREYCEETDFAREFLEGAVARDDARMRAAVKKFVAENAEELLN